MYIYIFFSGGEGATRQQTNLPKKTKNTSHTSFLKRQKKKKQMVDKLKKINTETKHLKPTTIHNKMQTCKNPPRFFRHKKQTNSRKISKKNHIESSEVPIVGHLPEFWKAQVTGIRWHVPQVPGPRWAVLVTSYFSRVKINSTFFRGEKNPSETHLLRSFIEGSNL